MIRSFRVESPLFTTTLSHGDAILALPSDLPLFGEQSTYYNLTLVDLQLFWLKTAKTGA